MEATQAAPVKYDMEVVRWFTVAAAIYAVVGTLVGVWIAAELGLCNYFSVKVFSEIHGAGKFKVS